MAVSNFFCKPEDAQAVKTPAQAHKTVRRGVGSAAKQTRLTCEFLMLDPCGLQGIGTEAAFFILLIVCEIAFKPFHMRIALKGSYMGTDPVQKKAVVGDDHSAAGKINQSIFERP